MQGLFWASSKLPGDYIVTREAPVVLFWKGRVEKVGRWLVEKRLIKNRTGYSDFLKKPQVESMKVGGK